MTESQAERRQALVLGLVGGIASGKSTVARLLAGPEGVVIDADALAHEVLDSPGVVRRVRERFGSELIGADGKPDRTALAARVFAPGADPALREELADWIHPAVRARILELLSEALEAKVARVVLDVPLLLESAQALLPRCDAVIFVDTRLEDRDRRARESRGWASGEVARRESSQLSLEEKRRRADHVIPNHGSLEELERAVAEVLSVLGAG